MSMQKESMPPLPPAPKAFRVVSEWRGPLNPPPKKKRTESREAKQDESIPPLPPAPKVVEVVSMWSGPKLVYEETGELVHPEIDGSKLARLVMILISSLRRLIKLVRRFISRSAK